MADDKLAESVFPFLENLHKSSDLAHNFKHITMVACEVREALQSEEYCFLAPWQKNALVAAAYLHEVDDEKLNINIIGVPKEGKLPNAKTILAQYSKTEQFQSLTLEIIGLVSTRSNHNTTVDSGNKWKLLVRDADRGQTLGKVGIARCYAYTLADKKPFFTSSTPLCKTKEELWQVATPERFAEYHGKSSSMIDHYYDKLLHIGEVSSGDEYLRIKMERGHKKMVDFVLKFGRTETLDFEYLENLVKEYC